MTATAMAPSLTEHVSPSRLRHLGSTHVVWSPEVLFCLMVVALTFMPIPGHARTWVIREDGSGDMPTIQGGIVRAVNGDTVLVMPGTYHEDIDFLGKGVLLKSDAGPEVTILNGANEDSSIVIFKRGESSQAVLDGFTLTGGVGTPRFATRDGGAVFCLAASPIIQNNIFSNNRADWGGAMSVGEPFAPPGPIGSPVIQNNMFLGNRADRGGGGLFAYSSNVAVQGNEFRENRCDHGDGGGAFFFINIGSVVITENQFIANEAPDHGGGLITYSARDFGAGRQAIEDNLFADNVANGLGNDDNGAGGGLAAVEIWGSIRHNTFVNNRGFGETSCEGGGLALLNTRSDLDVSGNLVAFNEGCAISCFSALDGTVGVNLLWGNMPTVGRPCPNGDPPVIQDPWLCNLGGGDYRVATNSPALGDGFYFGAYPTPGCNAVPVTSLTTWSNIKARYWRDGTVLK